MRQWLLLARDSPQWESLLAKAFDLAAKHVASNAADARESIDRDHVCEDCGREFGSFDALRSHQHRVHGYMNPGRIRSTSPICLSCLTCFHSMKRLCHHFQEKKGKRCADLLAAMYTPLSVDDVRAIESHYPPVSTNVKQSPAVRLSGPHISLELAVNGPLVLTG